MDNTTYASSSIANNWTIPAAENTQKILDMANVIRPWFPSVEDRSCVEYTRDGREFEEIYCVYPWLKKYYMKWVLFACLFPIGLSVWRMGNSLFGCVLFHSFYCLTNKPSFYSFLPQWYPSFMAICFNANTQQTTNICCYYYFTTLLLLLYSWELNWRPMWLYDFLMDEPWFPIVCVGLYLFCIVAGPKYMESRPPYVMKKTLAAWNLGLALFSIAGVIRSVPTLVHSFYTYGFEEFLCNDPQNSLGSSATTVWGMFFVLSKPAYV